MPGAAGEEAAPEQWLAVAAEHGLRGDLELACLEALVGAGEPPGGRLLFVNLSPSTLSDPRLPGVLRRLPDRLVLELTEQSPVVDYGRLRAELEPWIARGARLAVDDTGSGYASLEHVVELRPDYLKLTRALVVDIDLDPGRQALLRALVAFAREVGSLVVAEGVERPPELDVLRSAEVDFVQGFLLGRPQEPWPALAPGGLREQSANGVLGAPPTRRGTRAQERLQRALDAGTTHGSACEAVVDHLARQGLMPSIYFAQGGRLRCQAVRGYWQIYDGMPVGAGVIGTTFRTGEPTIVLDVAEHGDYLEAVPGVAAEICVPVHSGGRVIGALNVESPTRLGSAVVAEVDRCAELLGRTLTRLGPQRPASVSQRVARGAARLAALSDEDELERELVAVARDVSGLESAMIAVGPPDALTARCAAGPFEYVFAAMDAEELALMASWVTAGTSALTMGDSGGQGFVGHERLRRAGAGTMIVLPLAAPGHTLGLLALASRSVAVLTTEDVELLELLATQGAGALRTAAAVRELRRRASTDPLTGLGHHATFHSELPARRGLPRRGRLAVLVADIDGFKAINDTRGHASGDQVLRAMAALLTDQMPAGSGLYRVGGDEFAAVVDVGSAGDAEDLGGALRVSAPGALGTTLSIGIAIGTPGEADAALLARADAALYEVKRGGRDGVVLAAATLRARAARA